MQPIPAYVLPINYLEEVGQIDPRLERLLQLADKDKFAAEQEAFRISEDDHALYRQYRLLLIARRRDMGAGMPRPPLPPPQQPSLAQPSPLLDDAMETARLFDPRDLRVRWEQAQQAGLPTEVVIPG